MKNIYLFFLILIFPFITNLSAQGFELFFDNESGDKRSVLFTDIPNSNNYLSIWKTDTELRISELNNNGNLIQTVTHEIGIINDDLSTIKITENSILIGYVSHDNLFTTTFGIFEFDFTGTLINSVSEEFDENWDEPAKQFNDNNELVVFSDVFSGDDFVYSRMGVDNGIEEYKKIPESSLSASSIGTPAMLLLPNGDIIVLTRSDSGNEKSELARIDEVGEIVWQVQVPVYFVFDRFMRFFSSENKILLYGDNGDTSGFGTYFSAYSTSGEELWIEDFTEQFNSIEGYGVIPGEDDTFFAHGRKYTDMGSNLVLVKIATDGSILWEKSHNFFNSNNPGQLLRDIDGGFFIATEGYPGPGLSSDPHIVKYNSSGDTIWSWNAARDDYYLHNKALITTEGEYLVCGSSMEASEDYQAYFLKADSIGNVYEKLITGNLGFDLNETCVYDETSTPLSGWMLEVQGLQTSYAMTDEDGFYSVPINGQDIVVMPVLPNNYWTDCDQPWVATFPDGIDEVTLNVAIPALEYCPSVQTNIGTNFLRRCFENIYYVNVRNEGTATAENIEVKIGLDEFFIFTSSSLPPISQIENVLTFNIEEIGINEEYNFTINFDISCEAELGQIHCTEINSEAENNCVEPLPFAPKIVKDCQPNIGAYDPNDKAAFTSGEMTNQYILADSLIEYRIRFQNTGTDTAFNIVVIDTLEAGLNIQSFRPGAFSHPYDLEILGDNVLKFTFSDIQLVDSFTNEPASNGFLQFSIFPYEGLISGDFIGNQAAIYFDFNEPIFTNYLNLEIALPVSTAPEFADLAELLSVFPQPATRGELNFALLNSELVGKNTRLEIVNILGKRIHQEQFQEEILRVQNLPVGTHFYRLIVDNAVQGVGKIIMLK